MNWHYSGVEQQIYCFYFIFDTLVLILIFMRLVV